MGGLLAPGAQVGQTQACCSPATTRPHPLQLSPLRVSQQESPIPGPCLQRRPLCGGTPWSWTGLKLARGSFVQNTGPVYGEGQVPKDASFGALLRLAFEDTFLSQMSPLLGTRQYIGLGQRHSLGDRPKGARLSHQQAWPSAPDPAATGSPHAVWAWPSLAPTVHQGLQSHRTCREIAGDTHLRSWVW